MRAIALVAVLAAVIPGCGPSTQDVLDEYADRFATIRGAFPDIAKALADDAPTSRKDLDPAPVWNEHGEGVNVEILMESELIDPDGDTPSGGLDLRMSGDLLRAIQWTGPDSPMSDSVRGESVRDGLREELEAALAIRYLVVVRTLEFVEPRGVDEERFTDGLVRMRAFLVDLTTRETLISKRFGASTSDSVEYVYQEGEDRKDAMVRWARSSLWENARKALIRRLGEVTNGTFVLED